MISESLDLRDFVQAVGRMDLMEILETAHREATEAERLYYQLRSSKMEDAQARLEYSKSIKDLITFMRYGMRCRGLDDGEYELLQSLCANLRKRSREQLRCQGTA